MKPATPFDLEGSLRQWNDELAAQSGLSPESRLELETHLRDAVGELCRCGLSGDEAFWLARRRVGATAQVAEEFAKTNPVLVWRGWVLRAAFALLAVRTGQAAIAGLIGGLAWCQLHYGADPLRLWWVDGLQRGLQYTEMGDVCGALLTLLLTGIGVVGFSRFSEVLWRLFFQSRARFAVIGFFAVLGIFWVEQWSARVTLALDPEMAGNVASGWRDFHLDPQFSSALIIVVLWLMPSLRKDQPAQTRELEQA